MIGPSNRMGYTPGQMAYSPSQPGMQDSSGLLAKLAALMYGNNGTPNQQAPWWQMMGRNGSELTNRGSGFSYQPVEPGGQTGGPIGPGLGGIGPTLSRGLPPPNAERSPTMDTGWAIDPTTPPVAQQQRPGLFSRMAGGPGIMGRSNAF
jgi:hypothetical protein